MIRFQGLIFKVASAAAVKSTKQQNLATSYPQNFPTVWYHQMTMK